MAERERDEIRMPPVLPNNVFCCTLPDGTHVLGELYDDDGNPLACDAEGNPLEGPNSGKPEDKKPADPSSPGPA